MSEICNETGRSHELGTDPTHCRACYEYCNRPGSSDAAARGDSINRMHSTAMKEYLNPESARAAVELYNGVRTMLEQDGWTARGQTTPGYWWVHPDYPGTFSMSAAFLARDRERIRRALCVQDSTNQCTEVRLTRIVRILRGQE